MSERPCRVILLGPQRPRADVGEVVSGLGVAGPVALVTAGRQEWEEDDRGLREVLGPEAFNLRLYERAERVWQDDPELRDGHRSVQHSVRTLRRAYNLRLARQMDAWVELGRLSGDPDVLEAEGRDALEAVRVLDRHHLERLGELRSAFEHRYQPLTRLAVAKERSDIERALQPAEVVVVDGGHVPVLLNRLRLFGMAQFLAGKTVVACSGGGMALAERVVLFHDSPPWGPGHAEVGEVGLGLYPGVISLPHGATRLRLDDPGRVSRFARRFSPAQCVLLEAGTRVEWDGHWHPGGVVRLTQSGQPEPWAGAA